MSRRLGEVTPDLLIRAYGAGVFPMAEGRHSERIYWLDPALRGVLPLDAGFHLSRRLRRTALSDRFRVSQGSVAMASPVFGADKVIAN